MSRLIFKTLPPWLLGPYGCRLNGRSPTPNLDRLSARGTVFDNVYRTGPSSDLLSNATGRNRGLDADVDSEPPISAFWWQPLSATRVTDVGGDDVPAKIPFGNGLDPVAWLPSGIWDELVQCWAHDGFELPDNLTPAALAQDLDADVAEALFDTDFVLGCDEAAMFLVARIAAVVADIDRALGEEWERAERAGHVIVLAASTGVCPAGVLADPRLDQDRQVPLVVVGPGVPVGRNQTLFAAEDLLEVVRSSPAVTLFEDLRSRGREVLVFREQADDVRVAHSCRDADGLFAVHESNGETIERFFAKPDDRWNQLNLAAQQGERLASYREKLRSSH